MAQSIQELYQRSRQQHVIREIDNALARIEEGDYGYCEVSGEEIGVKRLLARPIASMCVEVQERFEHRAARLHHGTVGRAGWQETG